MKVTCTQKRSTCHHAVKYISTINDVYERRSQRRRGKQSGKGMVEMKRSDWGDLRRESTNENEGPDIPDSDSTDVALRVRNMDDVS